MVRSKRLKAGSTRSCNSLNAYDKRLLYFISVAYGSLFLFSIDKICHGAPPAIDFLVQVYYNVPRKEYQVVVSCLILMI